MQRFQLPTAYTVVSRANNCDNLHEASSRLSIQATPSTIVISSRCEAVRLIARHRLNIHRKTQAALIAGVTLTAADYKEDTQPIDAAYNYIFIGRRVPRSQMYAMNSMVTSTILCSRSTKAYPSSSITIPTISTTTIPTISATIPIIPATTTAAYINSTV